MAFGRTDLGTVALNRLRLMACMQILEISSGLTRKLLRSMPQRFGRITGSSQEYAGCRAWYDGGFMTHSGLITISLADGICINFETTMGQELRMTTFGAHVFLTLDDELACMSLQSESIIARWNAYPLYNPWICA